DLFDLQLLEVVDERLDVVLVGEGGHRLRDHPLVVLLLEDDLALVAVGDAELVDVVRALDLRKVRGRLLRGSELLILLRLLPDEEREPPEHEHTDDDSLVTRHGSVPLSTQAKDTFARDVSRMRQRRTPYSAKRSGTPRMRTPATVFCVPLRACFI